MTHLDRALSKTYGVSPSAAPPATGLAGAAGTLRGWVDDLRTPRPPLRSAWAWPAICDRLLSAAGPGFRQLAAQLLVARTSRNLQSIAFCGGGRNTGVTSVVLSLAKLLHDDDAANVLLVDADLQQTPLTLHLGLSAHSRRPSIEVETLPGDFTWRCLDERRLSLLSPPPHMPRDEALPICAGHLRAAIRDLRSRIALGPGGVTGNRHESELAAADVQSDVPRSPSDSHGAYGSGGTRQRVSPPAAKDLIVVDAGPWGVPFAAWLLDRSAIDGMVYVKRAGHGPPESENPAQACHEANIEYLGMIETFTGNEQDSPSAGALPQNVHMSGKAN